MDYSAFNNNSSIFNSTQKDSHMPEHTIISHRDLMSKIDDLEEYYNINMSKSIIEDNSLPQYFRVNQINENTVVYNFEVDEGSAELSVINFNTEYEFNEYNEVLDRHIENITANCTHKNTFRLDDETHCEDCGHIDY